MYVCTNINYTIFKWYTFKNLLYVNPDRTREGGRIFGKLLSYTGYF